MFKLKGFAAPYMLGAVIGVTVVSTTVANQAREKNQSSYNKYIKQKQDYMRNTARGLDYFVSTEGTYEKASKNRLTQNFYSNAFDVNNSLDLSTKGSNGEKVSIISGDANSYKRKNRGNLSRNAILKQNNSGKAVIALNENKVRKEQILKSYVNMREASKELYKNIILTKSFKMPCTLNPTKKDAWGRDFTYTYIDDNHSKLSFNLPWSTSKNKVLPIELPELPAKVKEIKRIAFQKNYTNSISYHLLTEDGDVWVIGNGVYGQLGINKYSASEWTKIPVPNIKEVYIAANSRDVLYLTNDGDVWVTGSNSKGQLGLGHKNKVRTLEKTSLKDIVDISSNGSTYALDKNGALWVAGANTTGQLGIGNKTEKTSWVKSNLPVTNVKRIYAEWDRGFVVTENGELWVVGNNQYGKLGLPSATKEQTSWVKVVNSGVEKKLETDNFGYNAIFEKKGGGYVAGGRGVSSSWTQYSWKDMNLNDAKVLISTRSGNNGLSFASYQIKNNGDLWVFGINTYSVLGVSTSNTNNSWVKTPIKNAAEVLVVDYMRVYVRTTDGKVYVTGNNRLGQLGTGNEDEVKTWTDSGLSDIKQIVHTDVHMGTNPAILAVSNTGDVWVAGDNGNGQLGFSDPAGRLSWEKSPITNVKEIRAFDTAVFAIKNNGQVWVTGKNGSSNLGLGSNTNQMGWVQAGIDNVDDFIIGAYKSFAIKGKTLWLADSNHKTWAEVVGPNSNNLSDGGGSCP